jgi:hypothetical protein
MEFDKALRLAVILSRNDIREPVAASGEEPETEGDRT